MKKNTESGVSIAPKATISWKRTIVTAALLLLLICAFLFLWAYTIAEGYFGSYVQRNEQIGTVMEMNPGLVLTQAQQESLIPAQTDWDAFQYSHLCDIEEIISADGTQLSGRLYDLGYADTLLVLPQYNETSESDALFAPWFAEQGYNVLLTDARAHGRSGGKACGFGWIEWSDVQAWINWLSNWRGDGHIVLYGVGMGANAALLWAAQAPENCSVDLIIVESPYASLYLQGEYTLRQTHSISWFPFGAAIQWKVDHAGLGYTTQTAVLDEETLRGAEIPALILVAQNDNYIPPEYSTAACEAYPGPKELYEAPCGHGLFYGPVREETYSLLGQWVQ